jgi:predicted enzyme involved in methoxymalonyl-ACP biosynthesis
VICRPLGSDAWEIDTWLMSCRVLGRKVEHVVLREILEHARAAGIRRLLGTYRPTERNKLVVDHYQKLGFNKVREEESGLTEWELLVDSKTDSEVLPMNVVSSGFTIAAETPIS